MADNSIEDSIYTDLKKAAVDRSVWWTLRKDCHKPSEWADHWKKKIRCILYHKMCYFYLQNKPKCVWWLGWTWTKKGGRSLSPPNC